MKKAAPERVDRMLEILATRGQHAFQLFCKVLKGEHRLELAYMLQREAYRKEQELFW